jgi:uncharacterized RDD family membrane protein YckC
MTDESTGSTDEPSGGPSGPPPFPGEGAPSYPASAPPPPMPPPMPPPAPPSYPSTPSGGYPPPPPGGQYAPPGYAAPSYAAPGYGAPIGVPYASWGIRLGGWLIDLVIFIVIQGVVNRIVRGSNALTWHFTTKSNGGTVIHYDRISFLAVIITFVIGVAYATILCGSPRGQTVGMMAVGVRVVRDTGHGPLGYGAAFARSLIEQIFRFTVIVWLVDMLFPLWDGKRQTLHDKIVTSVVIRIRNAG